MTAQTKKIILATIAVVTVFAAYETVKTVLFPQMESVTSHVISTIVVGVTTIFIARYVFSQQLSLLDEREESNQRLQEALVKSERDENLLRSIVASVAEGLVITDRESNVLIINDAARELLGVGRRPVIRLTDLSRDPQFHKVFASACAQGELAEARFEARPITPSAARRSTVWYARSPTSRNSKCSNASGRNSSRTSRMNSGRRWPRSQPTPKPCSTAASTTPKTACASCTLSSATPSV
jgi:PAS domain-containing protein